MAIRVYKVAEVIGGRLVPETQSRFAVGDIAAFLTNLEATSDPIPDQLWTLDLVVGVGPAARRVAIDLPPLLSRKHEPDTPAIIGSHSESGTQPVECLVYFRNRLFAPTRKPANESDREEIFLRVKKAVYEEDRELSSLRSAVADFEAAIRFQKEGPRRDPIPDHVKLVVWARDGGACVRCGSKKALHFDHIIPFAKGGGNSESNIQILCESCNLDKSDKIAF